jgi:tRNA A37 methylthiotransferase MiaB
MAGQVPEPVRRERAADLLALAAELRARTAARRVGSTASVLFERRLRDGRWLGHAEDPLLVAAPPADDRAMDNAIGRVRLARIDRVQPDRVEGRVLELDPGRSLRTTLPVGSPPPSFAPPQGDAHVE